MTRQIRTIGVLGHYGTLNMGDEAIVAAVIEQLRSRIPDADFVCISMNPDDTASRHGVSAVQVQRHQARPLRRQTGSTAPANTSVSGRRERKEGRLRAWIKKTPGTRALYAAARRVWHFILEVILEVRHLAICVTTVRRIDLLVFSGSGQFVDAWGGPAHYPYTLFKWSLLAKIFRVPTAILSMGAGPIDAGVSKRMLASCVKWSIYASFRDEDSANLVRSFTSAPVVVAPDLALAISIEKTTAIRRDKNLIGLNVMPILDRRYWHSSDPEAYSRYVREMAQAVHRWLEEGREIKLIGTQLKDLLTAEDVLEHLTGPERCRVGAMEYGPQATDLLIALQSCGVVVASRFHAIVLSVRLGIPAVAIYKDNKQREFMRQLNADGRALSFDSFTADELHAAVAQVSGRTETECALLTGFVEKAQSALHAQYDEVLRRAAEHRAA